MQKKLPSITIQIDLASWRRIPGLRRRLQRAAEATSSHLPAKLCFPFNATVLLTGNKRVRQLNHDFRGIDKATNVLSFPQHDPAGLTKLGKAKGVPEIGDIALAYQYIVFESKNNNNILINHVTHLIIHGLLHLFGYNHEQDDEAELMEKLETEIMKSLGLPNPYAPHVGGRKSSHSK